MSGAGSFFLMEVSVILLVSQSCHEFLSQYSRDFSVWESSSPWRGLALPFPYILEWLVFLGFFYARFRRQVLIVSGKSRSSSKALEPFFSV